MSHSLPNWIRTAVIETYSNDRQLLAAFDNEDEAIELLMQLHALKPAHVTWEEAGKLLNDWRINNDALNQRLKRHAVNRLFEPHLQLVESQHPAVFYEQQVLSNLKLDRVTRKTSISKLLHDPDNIECKEQVEEAERRVWASRLAEFIEEAGLPVTATIQQTANPTEAWQRIFGSKRAKTLRNRARTWKKVREWMLFVHGIPFPLEVHQALDYLSTRMEEEPMKSVPGSIAASLSVIESAGQVALDRRISLNPTWKAAVEHWQTKAQVGHTSTQQAQRYTTAMLISLELMVVDLNIPIYLRAMAWVVLLMNWSCLRVDDLQGIDHRRFYMGPNGLRGVLIRTKTTGPGKKTTEVMFFIHTHADLTGQQWLEKGYHIWNSGQLKFEREYFIPKFDFFFGCVVKKMANSTQINAYIRSVLTNLLCPKRGELLTDPNWSLDRERRLLPESMATFFTGHSPRHWAPSVSAAMGVPKEQRDFLGRWQIQHGSNDYMLTAAQVIHSIQKLMTKGLLEGSDSYNEIELLEAIKDYAAKLGLEGDDIEARHTALLKSTAGYSLLQTFPSVTISVGTSAQTSNVNLSETELMIENEEHLEEDNTKSPYWISISSKSGFRRLHLRNGCGVLWFRCRSIEHVWSLKDVKADAVCKDCSKKMGSPVEDTSSSGSSSSEPDVPYRAEVFDIASQQGDSPPGNETPPPDTLSNDGSLVMLPESVSFNAVQLLDT
jgi:hypothetical protein